MKKFAIWGVVVSFVTFLITWGVIGFNLNNGDYNIQTLAYIGLVCWIVLIICLGILVAGNKCPHCGKIRRSRGEYCPYCGNKF